MPPITYYTPNGCQNQTLAALEKIIIKVNFHWIPLTFHAEYEIVSTSNNNNTVSVHLCKCQGVEYLVSSIICITSAQLLPYLTPSPSLRTGMTEVSSIAKLCPAEVSQQEKN